MSDITEHPTVKAKLYLCAIKDGSPTGSSAEQHRLPDLKSRLATQALNPAGGTRGEVAGCVLPATAAAISKSKSRHALGATTCGFYGRVGACR